jgi:hypothetical protein
MARPFHGGLADAIDLAFGVCSAPDGLRLRLTSHPLTRTDRSILRLPSS